MNNYQLVNACGFPHLLGHAKFVDEEIFGLRIGQIIVELGTTGRNNKITSSNRIQTWEHGATYSGSITLGDEKFYAFKLDEKEYLGSDKPLYTLFNAIQGEDRNEFILKNLTFNSILIYNAVYKLKNG